MLQARVTETIPRFTETVVVRGTVPLWSWRFEGNWKHFYHLSVEAHESPSIPLICKMGFLQNLPVRFRTNLRQYDTLNT